MLSYPEKNTENIRANNIGNIDYLYNMYQCANLRYRFGARYGYPTKETSILSCYAIDLLITALILRKEIKGE